MAEIGFYHLTSLNLAAGLSKLLLRAHGSGMRVLVSGRTDACIDHLNEALWKLDPNSFLPHGSTKEPQAENQPILLTTDGRNQNRATALMIVEDAPFENAAAYDRIFYLFEDRDETLKTTARQRWKEWKDGEHPLVYWQQEPNGSWQKKA